MMTDRELMSYGFHTYKKSERKLMQNGSILTDVRVCLELQQQLYGLGMNLLVNTIDFFSRPLHSTPTSFFSRSMSFFSLLFRTHKQRNTDPNVTFSDSDVKRRQISIGSVCGQQVYVRFCFGLQKHCRRRKNNGPNEISCLDWKVGRR